IVVGECRGGEALDMLQAMNTGHDGSMTTVHANTAKDAISRIETLVMFSGVELPSKAIREQIAGGIHMIVQLSRFSDGTRKITDIAELTGMEGSVITLQSIFTYQQEGVDADRKVVGKFRPSGVVPKFFDELQQKGIDFSREIFIGTSRI
ncbi:MAG: ATPase, T2SS/T4P/T4SS family, partial [Pseudomonadota bacterium]